MIERIAILGTGLIGGSLALAWQQHDADCTIVGFDRPNVLEKAEARGAIDEKAVDPVTAVQAADLVVLATPIGTTLRLVDAIADALPPDAIVTDVGSVKQPILDQAADVLPEDILFLGGHPMAGSEQTGIDHADPLLFENATYALCLPDDTDPDALDGPFAPAVGWIEATGARPLRLDAAQHDQLVAQVSHLPQVLAVALVNTVAGDDAPEEAPDLALQLAGGGFRDMTRIASSSFDVWRDILVGNERAIHDAVGRFRRTLRALRNRLLEEDLDALEAAFDEARAARDMIPKDAKGFLSPLADVYVRAPDEPGVLHDLTGHLADAGLNVKDIELQTVRDGTGGTFRLAFAAPADADAAVSCLADAGYNAWCP
ncbi:MAG: prephenate dehydrogenase/arogenate dehydrogenase family protein [Salinivenus sp.]